MANTSCQGLRQATVRASTSTALSYEGDWEALFDQASIGTSGGFDGRLLAWINAQLSTSHTNVNNAMQAFAVARGSPTPINWSSMGTFTIGGGAAASDPVPIIF